MQPNRLTGRTSLALLLFTALPSLALAQAYQRIAPHQLPAPPVPSLQLPPSAPTPVNASQNVLLPALKGLVFLGSNQLLTPTGQPDSQTGIHQQGLPNLPPDFTSQMAGFLGRPVTLASLDNISQATQDWYRAHGQPFLYVSIPPQNITNGIVQVVVTQYRVGSVRVVGNRWFSAGLIKHESGLTRGQTLGISAVRADMRWLNENSFRTVNAVFSPGVEQGESVVTLQTQDRLPLYVYGTYDNQGVSSLGRGEWGVGAIWGNAFGRDQTLSYQFTRSETGRYNAHSVSWLAPLPWRDKILVFGSYSTETPKISGGDGYFNQTGHSYQASARYVHDLPMLQITPQISLTSDIQVGYDFKNSNNNLEFGGVSVFKQNADVDQFPIILDATENDEIGQTVFQNNLSLSPGGLTGSNNNAAFKRLVPGSCASYYVEQVGLTRTTFLPKNFSWISRVLGQVANHNLMYSEQLALGGMDSIRGYSTDTALGSEGVITQNEIRTPPVSLMQLVGFKSSVIPQDEEQFGVFFDYGHISQVLPISGAINAADLSSGGLNLHTTLSHNATLTWDLGWRLRNAPNGSGQGHAFGDVSLTVGF